MNRFADGRGTVFGAIKKHPLITIIIIGLAARFILMPLLTVAYDSNFWAMIIRNFESGDGLYGLEGYYYTPVWGYILGFWSVLQESFLNIDLMGVKQIAALPLEGLEQWYFTSTITTVSFNFWFKIPFVVSDFAMSYLVFWLVREKTRNERKAITGFGLCFLCPMIIGVCSVSGMFDTFSVVMTLLCIILFHKEKYFLGGAMFSLAVLTKFFPAFILFFLVVYILKKHKTDGKAVQNLLFAASGAIIAFLILMMPQILDGTFADTLSFITNRAGTGGDGEGSVIDYIVSKSAVIFYSAMILVSAYLAYRMYKGDNRDLNDKLMTYSFVTIAGILMYPPTPQYVVLLIPFLVYHILVHNPNMKSCWKIISIGSLLFVLCGNAVLLLGLGSYTDIVSLDTVTSWIDGFLSPVLGTSWMGILYLASAAIQYVGIASIFWLSYRENKIKNYRSYAEG